MFLPPPLPGSLFYLVSCMIRMARAGQGVRHGRQDLRSAALVSASLRRQGAGEREGVAFLDRDRRCRCPGARRRSSRSWTKGLKGGPTKRGWAQTATETRWGGGASMRHMRGG